MTELPKIVRDRLREQASGRVDLHPDADLLTAFCERTLTASERQQVMAHLALCSDCRHSVALAVPPEMMEPASGKLEHHSHGFGWAHWFALAASVVVVAAAVMQIPRGAQRSPEIEVATKESAPTAATRPQAEGDSAKLAAHAPALTAPAASAKPDAGLAQGYDSKSGALSDDQDRFKRNQVATTTVGGLRENKQQVQVASQPAAAPARSGDLQTGAGGGVGKGVVGGLAAGRTLGGIASSSAGSGRERVDSPAAPPPAVANQVAAEPTEENRRAAEAGKLKDGESVTSELSSTRNEDRQKEVGSKPAANQEVLDEKARTETPAAQSGYRQPEVLPMKKHPPEAPATKTEASTFGALASKIKAPLRWTVSSAGRVIRSLDGGKNWQDVAVAPGVRFRAIAVQDNTVWAGGDGGALFHSSDSGQTWTRRSLLTRSLKAMETESLQTAPADSARGPAPRFDIVRIDITAGGRVTVATSDRQSFVSTDAGQTWNRQ